jgi:Fe(3+) dicitrate transport protein
MLVYDYTISPSGSNNRLEDSEAISFWVMDNWQINDRLLLNLALRYEDVESSRREFSDKDRTVLKSERSNDTDEWLPGASFTYDISDQWQILAGVHKGFSPLGGGAKETEEPETSVNWEAGLRYRGSGVFLEAVGFVSNFDNKSENCSNASPCSNGATSGQFVTGEAEISGMEFTLSTIQEVGSMTIPIDLMYTYTSAEISEDNSESGYVDGDMLAAIPENTAAARIGLIGANGWGNYLVFKYTDWMCMDLGCNRSGSTKFDRSEDLVTVDFISRYPLDFGGTIFLKVENLFDEERIITRQPDGARPNKAMTARVGFEWNF